jgi:GMC oxidoreductase
MDRDTPDGVMKLRGGKGDLVRRLEYSEEYFDDVRTKMREIVESMGAGKMRPDPSPVFLDGASFGRLCDGIWSRYGVVDSYGKVFGYDDLYVANGSVVPGPVGPKPTLSGEIPCFISSPVATWHWFPWFRLVHANFSQTYETTGNQNAVGETNSNPEGA